MMKTLVNTAFVLVLFASLLPAQDYFEIRNPEIIQGVFHGETVPLRDFQPDPHFPNEIVKTAKPGYHPKKDWPLHEQLNPNALPVGLDPAFQFDYPIADASRAPLLSYEGQTYTSVDPSDPNADVGPNHVIQMINAGSGARFQVWDKAGNSLSGPNQFDSFFGFPGGLGDPIVLYDQLADRWLMSEFSGVSNGFYVAISTTPDPLGTWFTYSFSTTLFPDYPKYAIWPDAYYITTNESTPAIYAMDRQQMLAGLPATMQRFTTPSYPTIGFQATTPVHIEGATAPPAGSPGMFMRMADDAWSVAIPNDRLEIYELDIDFATPANSVLSGPTFLTTAPFDTELNGYSAFAAFSQPGSVVRLDPLREVLMYQIQYRNFGTHEAIVCNHVTDVDGADRGGIRWYELRRSGGGAWSIYQQGTYSPDADSRWMGAIALNGDGSIGLMYNVTSSSTFPGIRYTGRQECDPLGQMTEPETVIVNGSAANVSNRYGDYNSLAVDPSNDLTFWGTAQYNPNPTWSTRIAAFDLGACCDLAIDFVATTDEVCPDANDGSIIIGATTSNGPITYSIAGPVNQSNNTGIFTGLPDGVYAITVTDNGASSCELYDAAVIAPGVDITPPAIVCPADVTVACDAIYDLSETGIAAATDNCDPNPEITYTDLVISGDCEWECTFERTWTAEDIYGNASVCVQTIVSSAEPLIAQALSLDVNMDGVADPLVIGWSQNKVTIDASDAACVVDWMPSSGATASALEPGQVVVGADCQLGANPLDINGKMENPLLAETIELGIKLRLNPSLGKEAFVDAHCTYHPVIDQFLPTHATINDIYRLANIALGNIIGPPHLQELLEVLVCVNGLEELCTPVVSPLQETESVIFRDDTDAEPFVGATDFQVYPNPNQGILNINLTDFGKSSVTLEIYDAQGRLWQSMEVDPMKDPRIRMEISNLQNGLYLVKARSIEVGIVTKRVVLMK
ncbi:MAG TPA: T9SS type A sorting domain-containing protein [Saprospiraceae bacterium]|nr:T9SS type A sorting domain-containing protein [Saprospiraceae bacterium]HMQ82070.1 T9SS type A sorting domain-containing protein [Saprospiraceae bacterium]